MEFKGLKIIATYTFDSNRRVYSVHTSRDLFAVKERDMHKWLRENDYVMLKNNGSIVKRCYEY